jgi:hypothetical protein
MDNYKLSRSFRALLLGCLALALRAHAGPEYLPDMVLESSAPGLARSISGGISLPEKYAADYSITAYDTDGNVINLGKGPIPPVAVLDKPRHGRAETSKDRSATGRITTPRGLRPR